MTAYYNDNDCYCCEWLNNLIRDGLITPGYVDARSIKEVEPHDLAGYDRYHFFAGIAGWDLRCNSPDGPTVRPSGLARAPASPTRRRVRGSATRTRATSGRSFSGSSASAILQSFLENRLRQRLGTGGSIEYSETWKEKGTRAGRRYLRHTASARCTSGNGCIGWPTPEASDFVEGARTRPGSRQACLGRALNRLTWNTTGIGSALNPAMCRWLMRFPQTWDLASPNFAEWYNLQELIGKDGSKPTATPSCRNWRQCLYERQ